MLIRPFPAALGVCAALCLSVVAASAGHAQKVATRARSSVLLRAPDSTVARVRAPVRPRVDSAPVRATRTAPATQTPLTKAVAAVVPTRASRAPASETAVRKPAAVVPVTPPKVTPQEAAVRLAKSLYGGKAREATVTVINPRTAAVWIADTAVKQPAPPGLDVDEGVSLPFRFIVIDSARGDTMALKPWFDDGGGLRYDSRAGAYIATLRIGLRDTLHGKQRRVLSPMIKLSVAAIADEVTPEVLEVGETNVFITKARLMTRRIASAMRVRVWPDFSERSVDVWVPFQPDSVMVRVDRASIAGFGLDETNVTVELSPGAAAPGDSIAVSLEATHGTFASGPVVYPKGGSPVVTRLRSSGMGPQLITARAGVLVAGQRALSYTFPMGLLGGGVLGALLGAIMVMVRDRGRPLAPAKGWIVLSGVLAGVLTALIAAIGVVKIPGFTLPPGGGAIVSILAGALGGYVGPKGFESLFGAFGAGRQPTKS
jgi:hypothetical protein